VYEIPIIEYMSDCGCEKSHPIIIGGMGLICNHLREECESSKEEKGKEIHMG
jgi:hypothetical protein